ncbi:MAG: GTPase obg [Microgenomates bacterium 39_7]|nr:MAG: GTPase obg [Microgenomates bacterium 39_7]
MKKSFSIIAIVMMSSALLLSACSGGQPSESANVPAEYAGKTNPLGADAADAGKSVYEVQCSSCHGDGGKGGSVIFQADKNLNTLKNFAGVKIIEAKRGEDGGKNRRHGGDGEDVVVKVPLGTVVWLVQENEPSHLRRRKYEKSLADFEFDLMEAENEAEDVGVNDQDAVPDSVQKEAHENEVNPFRLNTLLDRNDVTFRKFFQDFGGNLSGERGAQAFRLRPVNLELEQAPVKHFTQLDKILDIPSQEVGAVKLVELKHDGEQVVLCQGGLGGRGNRAFRSSTNQTPREAQYGTFGEKKEVILELKLLADLGLVGLPNAGKSTLLSRLTKAHPKIANYPFTTIEPNLGVMASRDGERELVVADIPGLIEGASQGKGLGDRFLRHIENCQMLMYVLFLEEEVIFDQDLSLQEMAKQLYLQYQLLQEELAAYQPDLLNKSSLVTINKKDLYSSELVDEILAFFKKQKVLPLFFSGVTGEGLDEVKEAVLQLE